MRRLNYNISTLNFHGDPDAPSGTRESYSIQIEAYDGLSEYKKGEYRTLTVEMVVQDVDEPPYFLSKEIRIPETTSRNAWVPADLTYEDDGQSTQDNIEFQSW